LVEKSGRALVRASGERGLCRLGEEMLSVAREEREALARPIEESQRRIAAMRQTVAQTERSLREIGYLFLGEKHRLSDLFLERRKKFLQENLPAAKNEARAEFRNIHSRDGPRLRQRAMQGAQSIAASRVLPWLVKEQAEAEKEYLHVANHFVNIGNGFLRKLSESQIPELSRMLNALNSETGFRAASRFRFEELLNVAQPASPLRYLADVILGAVGASSVVRKDAEAFCEHLLEMNSARVQSDLVERIGTSQDQLEAKIRKLLHEVTRVATCALEHARQAKARGAAAVEEKLQSISAAEKVIHALLETHTR
jgi:hypothetical protein